MHTHKHIINEKVPKSKTIRAGFLVTPVKTISSKPVLFKKWEAK